MSTEKKKIFEKAFSELIQHIIDRTEKDRGEHIYFENNPADPTLPHTMRDVNTAKLKEFTWLKCHGVTYDKGMRQLTKEEIEKIISAATQTSKRFSETHKQIICSFIPCPCCTTVSMIVKVSSQGRVLSESDLVGVDGWYQVDISPLGDSKVKIETETYRLEKTLVTKEIIAI